MQPVIPILQVESRLKSHMRWQDLQQQIGQYQDVCFGDPADALKFLKTDHLKCLIKFLVAQVMRQWQAFKMLVVIEKQLMVGHHGEQTEIKH